MESERFPNVHNCDALHADLTVQSFRALVVSAVLIVVGLALTANQANTSAGPRSVAEPTPVVAPAPSAPPTRIPLPTSAPPVIISRLARETPTPRPTSTPSAEPRVAVVDNGYLPSHLDLQMGSSVVWANLGGDAHDVTGTGPDGPWRSGPLGPRDSYRRPFNVAGVYDYACTVHPEMRGRITVAQL